MAEISQPCCSLWEAAHQDGTDNHGYGALIHDGSMGCGGLLTPGDFSPTPIAFCPWCGDQKLRFLKGQTVQVGTVTGIYKIKEIYERDQWRYYLEPIMGQSSQHLAGIRECLLRLSNKEVR